MSHAPTLNPGPIWQAAARRHWQLPIPLRTWLLDNSSLTAKLQKLSDGHFRVEILRQQLAQPSLSERRSLGLKQRQLALVREVLLYGGNQPWVFAHSVLPLSSLTGSLRRLRGLDNRPLGAFLFSQPGLSRGTIEVAALRRQHGYLPSSLAPEQGVEQPLWGRRSVFYLRAKPLLVSEVFLAPFVAHIAQLRLNR